MIAADVEPGMTISFKDSDIEGGEVIAVSPTKGSSAYLDIYFVPASDSPGRKLRGVWKKTEVVVHG